MKPARRSKEWAKVLDRGDEVIACMGTLLRLSAYSGLVGNTKHIKPHAGLAIRLQFDYADISPLRHL
jgi:hypothetical protein